MRDLSKRSAFVFCPNCGKRNEMQVAGLNYRLTFPHTCDKCGEDHTFINYKILIKRGVESNCVWTNYDDEQIIIGDMK